MTIQHARRCLLWAAGLTLVVAVVFSFNFHIRYQHRLGNGATAEQLRDFSWSWQGWMAGVPFLVAIVFAIAYVVVHHKYREVEE